MANSTFQGVMKFGKLYDNKDNYHGELLRGGNFLYRTIDQDKKGIYSSPSIYGFVDSKGDTSYYEHSAKSPSMSNLSDKGFQSFQGAAMHNFDADYMKMKGINKIELPEGMNIEQYYKRYFSKGKKPKNSKDKKGIFNFLKK